MAVLLVCSTLLTLSAFTFVGTGSGGEDVSLVYDVNEEMTRGTAYINEDTQFITIGNDDLEIVLDKNVNCGISKIIDKGTGLDLRGNKVPPPVILMLKYWTGSTTDIVIQWDADEMETDISSLSGGVRLTIDYTEFRSNNLNATVIIDLMDNSRYADFKLNVENDEEFTVQSLFFPLVWGLGQIGDSSTDDKVFYPVGDGLILTDPLEYKDDLHMSEVYPSTASMQMMCHYDEDEAGLYMMTDDSQGHPKKVTYDSMEWSAETHVAMFYEHLIPEKEGSDFTMDYNCQVGTFQGDWYDAADIYREWALTTDFISGGKVFEDKDTPDWWSKTSVVSSSNRDAHIVHNSLSSIEEMTQEFNDLTGVNTTHLIFAWAENGAWCGPYYFPPAAGEDNFISSMENITDVGGHSFLYISGSVWRITRDDIGYADYETFNDIGKKWVCLDQYGNPTIDPGYLAINWTSARMCPMTDFWHDMVVDNTLSCLDLGVDVVQIDEFPIGSVYPCYNESHGHSMGYSNEIPLAYRSILNDARTLGRVKNPDLIMSMEEPCEYYIPYMDTYVSRDNSPEFMIYPIAVDLYGDDVEFVPFFSHVYHEYITAFGEPIPMNMNYPELFINQMKRSLARSFITGEIVSGSADEKENLRPEVLDLYNTTVRASSGYCNEYMMRGNPLRPPEIDVPDTSVDWYFYSNQSIGEPFLERSVLHSSWEADDGDIGHVFINWVDEEIGFDLEIPSMGRSGEYSLMITRNGVRSVLERSTELPYTFTLETSPGEIVLIEVTHLPDLKIDTLDFVDHSGPVLVDDTYELESRIWNLGTDRSEPFDIDLLLDGVIVDTVGRSSMDDGVDDPVLFEWDTPGIPGVYNLSVIADREGSIEESDESNNIYWESVEILERPRGSLKVIVNDSRNGGLLENATVRLHSFVTGYLNTSFSDGNGSVFFTDLIAGTYDLNITMDHFFNFSTRINISEGEDITLNFSLDWIEYPFISGIVVDNETGDPVGNATVDLEYTYVSPFIIERQKTTSDGSFNFTDLQSGDILISVYAPGYLTSWHSIILNDTAVDLSVRMDRLPPVTGRITGKVLDNDTGTPLLGVRIRFEGDDSYNITDRDGQFIFPEILPGDHTLVFALVGYHSIPVNLTVIENETTDIVVRLVKTNIQDPDPEPEIHEIAGFIRDADRNPLAGARIEIPALNISTLTDENGYFIFDDIEPGSYTLIISADGFEDREIWISSNGGEVLVDLEEIEEDDPSSFGWLIIILVVIIILVIAIVIILCRRGGGSFEE